MLSSRTRVCCPAPFIEFARHTQNMCDFLTWAPSQVYTGKHHGKSTRTNHTCEGHAPLPHHKPKQQKCVRFLRAVVGQSSLGATSWEEQALLGYCRLGTHKRPPAPPFLAFTYSCRIFPAWCWCGCARKAPEHDSRFEGSHLFFHSMQQLLRGTDAGPTRTKCSKALCMTFTFGAPHTRT